MRDDIHRRLPIPRAWKGVVKASKRDADRGRLPALVAAAAARGAGLRPSFVAQLVAAAAATQGEMFPADAIGSTVKPEPGSEQDVLDRVVRNIRSEVPAHDALKPAVRDSIVAGTDAILREIAGHLQLEPTRDAADLLARLDEACAHADFAGAADRLLAAQRSPPRPILDLDAELRAP